MNLITIKPNLCKFTTCRDFVEEFHIGEQDFILASKSTYLKHFKDLDLNATVAFKSDYGPGEPTDIMCEAIMTDVLKSGCNRIIAIGGGAVIDIAKVLAVAQEGNRRIFAEADDVLFAPGVDPLLIPITEIVPLQLFAYYVAKENGCDIDKPKNLAKSVTVE